MLIGEGTEQGVIFGRIRRQFKRLGRINLDGLHAGRGIAQGQDAFLGRPGRPAINLPVFGPAAHPMRVHQRIGIGARPLGSFRQIIPVLLRHQGGRDIHFLQLRAVAEHGANFRTENIIGIIVQAVRGFGVNNAMEHQGIQRIQIATANDFVINIVVLVGNPALALRGGAAHKIMILAAAPDGVGEEQPERRRPGARGLVDIKIRLERAQLGNELEHGVKIALRAAATGAGILADTIEFELVDAVLLHHIHAQAAKALIIFRAGEREIFVPRFKALRPAELDAQFMRMAIPAPRGEPDTRRGAIFCRRRLNGREAMGKIGPVKPPQGGRIIPAVIKQE